MFDELASLANDPERLFDVVARRLAAAGDLHKLFDLRLLEHRRALGLALDRRTPIDEVDEPLRSQLETAYLAACREVGELFLQTGRLREAWMYFRPAGDKQALRQRLARITPDDDRPEHLNELIELALYEGVDPQRGYAWLLGRQGTCSAITTLDGIAEQLSTADLHSCAAVLVRHVYRELQGNLAGHLHRLKGGEPAANHTVLELITQHPELQASGDYHIDASHLASTMRYARLLTEPALVTRALEMAEYGIHLPEELQYPGDPPFEELFASHRKLFQATLGHDADAAVEFFADRARGEHAASQDASAESAHSGMAATTAIETYLVMLARTGRAAEALDAYGELVPKGAELSRHAPTLLELAGQSGDWERYAAICRDRNDVLGFTAGLLAKSK